MEQFSRQIHILNRIRANLGVQRTHQVIIRDGGRVRVKFHEEFDFHIFDEHKLRSRAVREPESEFLERDTQMLCYVH